MHGLPYMSGIQQFHALCQERYTWLVQSRSKASQSILLGMTWRLLSNSGNFAADAVAVGLSPAVLV